MLASELRKSTPWVIPNWLMNLVSFQTGWWAIVVCAASGRPALGLIVVAALLAWHLLRVKPYSGEWVLIGIATVVGLAFESVFQATGWVSYTGGSLASWLAPLWMAALWANFASTLNISLRPLQSRPWLAAGLGGLGGPAAYWGGAQLGAMSFHNFSAGFATLAVAWALLTPALLALAARLNTRVES